MSDVMNESVELDDEFFKSYSKKIQDDSKNQNNGGNYEQPEYDEVGYVGCEKGFYTVVRLLGAPIGAEAQGYKRKPYDPKEIITCEVKDDDGKRFTIKLPLRQPIAADNHILIRLYDKVMEKVKINGDWVYKNKTAHPEIFELVSKGGFKPTDGKTYQFSTGYRGDRVSIYNCIDYKDNWCAENKHTKILCRDLNIDDQNRVWAKPGIKSYGSVQKIASILGKDGSFEKYCLGFKKTGIKENPWEVVNASKMKEKDMLEELGNDDGSTVDEKIIKVGPMTDEERSYERYDLDKFFQPTTYQKIQKRISGLFKLCDAQLGTKFTEELNGLVAKEKEYFAKIYAKEEKEQAAAENKAIQENLNMSEEEFNAATSVDTMPDPMATPASFDTMQQVQSEEPAPATRRTRSAPAAEESGLSADKIALLKGWEFMSPEIKARVQDVEVKDGKVSIVWDRKDDLLQCDDCGALSPEEGVTHCPVCGALF